MRRNQIIVSAIAVLLVCGCSEWPPNEDAFRASFSEHRDDIEGLRNKLLDTKYERVGLTFGPSISATYFEGDPLSVEYSRTETPSDREEWLMLFEEADVHEIHREFRSGHETNDVLVDFPFDPEGINELPRGTTRKDSMWVAAYYHSADVESRIKECEPEFASANCGNCVVPLTGDWWIRYWWHPEDVTPDATKAWLNGEMAYEEYVEFRQHASDKCFADGRTLVDQPGNP